MDETIRIYCKNNDTYTNVPAGSSLLEIYDLVGAPLKYRPMNAQVNNKVESLTYRCWKSKDVEYMDYTHSSGSRAYIRSLCHIFAKAVYDVIPKADLTLEHPVSRGYYCLIRNGESITQDKIDEIKKRMQELIDADIKFMHRYVRTAEASELFHSLNMKDKARLIETSGMLYTSYYELDGYVDFFYGCLTPSTGYIHLFDIMPYSEGVLLRVPQRDHPEELEPVIRQDKMFEVYKEHLSLQRMVGLNNVGDLNLAVKKGNASEIIKVSEAVQEKQVAITYSSGQGLV